MFPVSGENSVECVNGFFMKKIASVQIKNLFMLSVRILSYGCTREVWRARKMRKGCTRR